MIDIESNLKRAVEHHQAGRKLEARLLYKLVLDQDPDEPDALHLLGQLCYDDGQIQFAAELIERAVQGRPGATDFHVDLARIYRRMGRRDDAIARFKTVFDLNPMPSPQLCLEFGHLLAASGDTDAAMPLVERAATENPSPDSLGIFGELLLAAGKTQAAVDRLSSAVELAPNRADLRAALARALERRGDYDAAESGYRSVIRMDPNSADARNNLARLLLLRGQTVEAAAEARRAVSLRPGFPQANTILADAVSELDQPDLALEHYRKALEADPRSTVAWDGLSRLLERLGEFAPLVNAAKRWIAVGATATGYARLAAGYAGLDQLDDAIAAGKTAAEMDPDSADRWNELGMALKWSGKLPEGIDAFRRALAADPNHVDARGNLCYALLGDDRATPEEILAAHTEWGRLHADTVTPLKPPRNDRTTDRRLRVGYVSPNFRSQAIMPFLLPVFESHDTEGFEIFAYSDVTRPDPITDRVKGAVNKWRDTAALDDDAFAAAVRADRIDILVELTGHIGHGRLTALARRPAPVQLSFIGYQGTTGSGAIDYVITDDHADPAGNERWYVEKPFRLGLPFFVYDPLGQSPLVGVRSPGPVTFGCLNAVHKITPRTIRLWAQIMRGAPDSKMIVLTGGSKSTTARIAAEFSAGGIASGRLSLVPRTDVRSYFRQYAQIDIALDPVPFVGHTTTCDAAWMGVPTVTLTGHIYAHRYGGSALKAAGLEDLVAETEETYVAAAVKLATDVVRLKMLRATLRSTLQRSPMTDAAGFTRRLEAGYRAMWAAWC